MKRVLQSTNDKREDKMKVLKKPIYIIMGILISMSSNRVYAEANQIQEVNDADFSSLAAQATNENKKLMILYYRDNCKACNGINQMQLTNTDSSKKLYTEYAIYKTNVSAGFDVVCPNGELYSDSDFMSC